MTLTTLVVGARAVEREAAIAAVLQPHSKTAVLFVCMPSGKSLLHDWQDIEGIHIQRIAVGCPCCNGNLKMRVTLHRLLRHSPSRLYISLATSDHLSQGRDLLTQTPYGEYLALTDDWLV